MMKIVLWYFIQHINFIVQMYSIILAAYLPNWKRILNIISSIYFFIFRTDEKYILKKWYYEKNGWHWKHLRYMKGGGGVNLNL